MLRTLIAFALVAVAATASPAADPPAGKPKRLLLVTHSGGFVHDSVGVAEDILKAAGPANGFEVTCFRFTGDPQARVKLQAKGKPDREVAALEAYNAKFRGPAGRAVEPENCGRINAETLKNFDAVLFFTTGDPLTPGELSDLLDWVKAGGAFAGVHCATDTLYGQASYGELIGAYFQGHPSGLQDIKLKLEDPAHPAAKAFTPDMPYKDEIYVFRKAPYDRSKLHIIISASDFKAGSLKRADDDYAVSWCKELGKGKVFYTSLGHQKSVWQDPKYQAHLFAGLRWSTGELPGSATPSGKGN